VKRVNRRHLAATERHDEQRGQGADPPAQHRDRVERGGVGPVHVLEHEQRRARRALELRDQQILDVVRGRPGGERVLQLARHIARQVTQGAERARYGQVVARAQQHTRAVVEVLQEVPNERGLADPRLAADAHHPARAARGGGVGLAQRGQRRITLQQVHADSRHVGTRGVKHR
jgi:hypothetical protein